MRKVAVAAIAKPEVYEALEERGVKYAIRIPADENLEQVIARLRTRSGPACSSNWSRRAVV